MQDYKILLRLLGIERYEVPMMFENGKLVFDGNLYELQANLHYIHEKMVESLESVRDSMKRYLIAVHGERFQKELIDALRNHYGGNDSKE